MRGWCIDCRCELAGWDTPFCQTCHEEHEAAEREAEMIEAMEARGIFEEPEPEPECHHNECDCADCLRADALAAEEDR